MYADVVPGRSYGRPRPREEAEPGGETTPYGEKEGEVHPAEAVGEGMECLRPRYASGCSCGEGGASMGKRIVLEDDLGFPGAAAPDMTAPKVGEGLLGRDGRKALVQPHGDGGCRAGSGPFGGSSDKPAVSASPVIHS